MEPSAVNSKRSDGIHLADYWRWVRQHFVIAAVVLAIGLALSWFYWQQLPRLYQAQALLRIDPIAYNQGVLRQIDDVVLGQSGAAFAQPATARPETRVAFYFSSPQFQADVAQLLNQQFAPELDAVSEELEAYGSARAEQLDQFVARHLHTFRNAIDGGHGVQWHFYDAALAEQQLELIVQLLDSNLRQSAIHELEAQLQSLQQLVAADVSQSTSYAPIEAVLLSRLQVIQSPEFALVHEVIPTEVNTSPRYPNRIPVLVVSMLTWCTLWVTVLNGYLLCRHRRHDEEPA